MAVLLTLVNVVTATLTSGADMGFFGDIFGGISSIFNMHQAEKQNDIQDNFARHGIRIKVNDAKDAGINPYFALGASTTMPGSVIGDTSGLSGFGQAVDRATSAGQTDDERTATVMLKKKGQLELDNMDLQNKILAADLAKKTSQLAPAVPSLNQRYLVDGQGEVKTPGLVKFSPMSITPSEPGNAAVEPGANPDVGYTATGGGSYAPVPSKAAMERQSNDMLGMIMWNLRNRLLPSGSNFNPPPDKLLRPGHVWQWNPLSWQYYQVKLPTTPF